MAVKPRTMKASRAVETSISKIVSAQTGRGRDRIFFDGAVFTS
jgi:hypothetical protein